MRAHDAISGAMSGQSAHLEGRPHNVQIRAEWKTAAGWGKLREVTAVKSILADVVGCEAMEIIAYCDRPFSVTYGANVKDPAQGAVFSTLKEDLSTLERRFELAALTLQLS